MKKLYISFLLLFFIAFNLYSADFWVKTNGPYGANINKIVIDDNGNIYLATQSDGVYRSFDKGNNWTSFNSNDMESFTWVNDLIITKNLSLFAATDSLGILRKLQSTNWEQKTSGMSGASQFKCVYQLKDGSIYAGSVGRSLYKSTNNGDSWSPVQGGQLGANETINCIIQANDGSILIGTNTGILKASSDGKNWSSVYSGGPVYCFAKNTTELTIMAGTNKGIYASSNNGQSWNAQSTGMGTDKKVISLAYHQDDYFIAGTEKNGFYYSDNSYFSWTAYNNGLSSRNIKSIAVNQNGEIFVGTNFAFYYLQDFAKHFELRINKLGERTINSFAMLQKRGEVIAATDLGIYRTTNNGDSWEQLNQGLTNLDVLSIVVGKKGDLLAGTNGSGLFYSNDLGETWKPLYNSSLDATIIQTLDTSSTQKEIFAGTLGRGVYKTIDESDTLWTQMYGGDIDKRNIISFAFLKSGYALAGTKQNGLYRMDQYYSWSPLNVDVGVSEVSAIAANPNNDGIFIGTNLGIYLSYSNGNNFIKAQGTLQGQAQSLTIDEKNNLYAGLRGVKGVSTSTDDGNTWQELIHPIMKQFVVKALDVSGRGYVYAGTIHGGCYRSIESMSNNILELLSSNYDTLQAQQGEKISYILTVKDLNGNIIEDATITVKSSFLPNWDSTIVTDINGEVEFKYTLPQNLSDGLYSFSFIASKDPFFDSQVLELYIDVQKRKVILEIIPVNLQYKDWNQNVSFDITTVNKSGNHIPNIEINIDNGLLNTKEQIVSDNQGKANYQFTVPDQHPEQIYQIKFFAVDPNGNYFQSDTILREIKVEHNDIIIDGEIDVCENETYVYKTIPDPNKRFLWKDIVNGNINGPNDLDSVIITWLNHGAGEITLEQEIISTGVKTSRTLQVTIHQKDYVQVPDSLYPICENETFKLPDGIPAGGIWSGQGVVNGVFYGEKTGVGTQKLVYTYTNQWGCSSSVEKFIEVKPIPDVSLNLDSTQVCFSYLAFDLTGGSPDGGTYSGDGVIDNKFYPSEAGFGKHSITYTYIEPMTECSNYAVQDIEVLDVPQVDFSVPRNQICLSEIAYDLSDKTNKPGKFYGPGVDEINKTFNANSSETGLGGPYIIYFETEELNQFGCPGVDTVQLFVIDVPQTPTATLDGSGAKIVSSSSDNNQWYYEGNPIPGANFQEYYPTKSGKYQVTVIDPVTGCESFLSNVVNFTAQAAEGILSTSNIPDKKFNPGEKITIPISVKSSGNLATMNIDEIKAIMKFNGSVLYPINQNFQQEIDYSNKLRIIHLDIPITSITDGTTLINLEFLATVGDAEQTDIIFDSVIAYRKGQAIETNITIETRSIEINVKSEGGLRLYNSWTKAPIIINVNPNPTFNSINGTIEVINSDWDYHIYLTDINGILVNDIYEGKINSKFELNDYSLGNLNSGVYYLVIQSPFIKKVQAISVIK